ncbi:MAG: OB-fold nucleic acid binding domain-containing protein, partial [bacterium]|nr:OB-fold nucleic acid binding domain-containing protein [bacterium]
MSNNIGLATPVKDVYSIGPVYAGRLKRLEIETVEDLLYHFPSRYEDFSLLSKINMIQPGETVTVRGVVEKITNEYSRTGKQFQKATIRDETENLDVVWFNQPFLVKTIRIGESYNFSGKVDWFGHKIVMVSPEYERQQCTIHTGRLVPVYPETSGLSSKWLRRQIQNLLSSCLKDIDEYLPDFIVKKYELGGIKSAISEIHFPENKQAAEQARHRMAFEEFLFLHLSGLIRKRLWEKKKTGYRFKISAFKKEIKEFWQSLPFALTAGQNRCVSEIFHDLACEKSANRLLQGDVGSGKTVVAAIAMYLSYLNGYKS